MTQVKICGITNVADAQVAIDAGADLLGLIFYPPSPRYVTLEQARAIVACLPTGCQAVGVFVNSPVETMTQMVEQCGLHLLQLHGEESPAVCQQVPCPVIKTFRFNAHVQPAMMRSYAVKAFLIEGFHAEIYGGGGVQADWQRVAGLHDYGRLILAGGLTPRNVQEAIRIVRPYAVDVCSGVEATPGKKDWAKVRAFVANAKADVTGGERPL